MKTIILLFSIFLTQNCNQKAGTMELQEKLPSAIEEVYYQKWIGGQEQTGSGIDFHIQFKSALPLNITLKKVYFQNQEAVFQSEDTINFTARFHQKPNSDIILDSDPQKEYGNKPPEIKNKKTNIQPNEAILEFVKNDKSFKIKIQNIKEKELLAYPSAKPRN